MTPAPQCETCILVGTRACMYHGYPENTIPQSCRYKVGVDAEEALKNLEGTSIIKNLLKRQQEQQGNLSFYENERERIHP